jgi:hypothetical protein
VLLSTCFPPCRFSCECCLALPWIERLPFSSSPRSSPIYAPEIPAETSEPVRPASELPSRGSLTTTVVRSIPARSKRRHARTPQPHPTHPSNINDTKLVLPASAFVETDERSQGTFTSIAGFARLSATPGHELLSSPRGSTSPCPRSDLGPVATLEPPR